MPRKKASGTHRGAKNTKAEKTKKIQTRHLTESSSSLDSDSTSYLDSDTGVRVGTPRSIKEIRNLVIGGGGTAGYCYMGAMSEIFDEEDNSKPALEDVKNYIGTSAGSIVTAILACTTDQDYLLNKFESFDVSALQDNSFGILMDLWRLYSKYGYNKGNYALAIAREVMEELTGDSNITFAQHYELTGNNLIITGTNTTTRHIVYFNRLTHPDMEVALAIRISMSLPLIFVPIKYENEQFRDILGGEGMYVDGGVIDNLPAHFVLTDLFRLLNRDSEVSNEEIENALKSLYHLEGCNDCDDLTSSENDEFRHQQLQQTIAIKSFSKETMSNISPGSGVPVNNPNSSVVKFCSNLISIFMDNGLKRHITADIWDRTLKIDIGTISTTDFDITEEDVQAMLKLGRESGIAFIEGR
jgi:NTE family protein